MNEVYDRLRFNTQRALNSLFACHALESSDILFKAVTLVNMAKKGFLVLTSRKVGIEYTPWIFRDTVVEVNFKGIKYHFKCAKGYDFNVYLNPYYHEYDVLLFALHILQKGDVLIDVGAHGGLYTLLGAMAVGSRGQVMAIEPNPYNLKILRNNVKLNELNNVTVVPKAASDKKSKINLYYEKNKTALTCARPPKTINKIIRTEAIPLDNVAGIYSSVKLLKIDTEGYDLKVLKGASLTLPKTSFIIVEQNDNLVKKLLRSFGFQIHFLTSTRYLVAINKKIGHVPILDRIFARADV